MIGVFVDFPDLAAVIKDEERDIIRLVTFGTADRMKARIAEPKSGNSYKRGDKVHIASAPGESPASDSGNLNNTIMPMLTANDLQGEITLADYGLYLEFGTSKLPSRPFVIPSLEEILESL